MPKTTTFDTAPFFSGGAGLFLQYFDVIKPVWLYAVFNMIISGESYGLPIDIIKNMTLGSILEWYVNRRYKNPFQQLDFAHAIPPEELDDLMADILATDHSIYKLTPMLNMERIFYVYRQQHMNFPVYVYTEEYDAAVKEECNQTFNGVPAKYLYGDLKEAIAKTNQNFTYIFSDIELLKQACDILIGTCSHVLLTNDYRYNYTDFKHTAKYDLMELMRTHPFLRLGTTSVWDHVSLEAFTEVTNWKGGDEF